MNKYFMIKQGLIINLDKVAVIRYEEDEYRNVCLTFYFSTCGEESLRIFHRDVDGIEKLQSIYNQLIELLGV